LGRIADSTSAKVAVAAAVSQPMNSVAESTVAITILLEIGLTTAKKVTIAIEKDRSATTHYQVCSKVAFVAGRPVVAPVAGRSCECHEEALGATGCLTAAVTRTTPAVVELMESDLENAGQPGPRAERVAVEEVPDAAAVAAGLTAAVIMPGVLVVLRRCCSGKR
jgi:hypothetical protein